MLNALLMPQFKEKIEYTKLSSGESVDIMYKKERRRRSYASLIVKEEKEKPTIDIVVRYTVH